VRTALGFRPHTGWSVAVAVSGTATAPQVVWRGRLELWRSTETAQVYHAVRSSRDLDAAGERVRLAADAAQRIAAEELGGLLAKLRADGYQPVAAVIPLGGMPVPGSLARILPSHSLLHAAEGELFRDALVAAAEHHRVMVSRAPPGDMVVRAARHLNWNQQSVLSTLAEIGRRVGPPWRKDEKDAALTAWLALAG
jgi:hypothetical protein